MTHATRPVLDIRSLVVHRDGTLILDRRVLRIAPKLPIAASKFPRIFRP